MKEDLIEKIFQQLEDLDPIPNHTVKDSLKSILTEKTLKNLLLTYFRMEQSSQLTKKNWKESCSIQTQIIPKTPIFLIIWYFWYVEEHKHDPLTWYERIHSPDYGYVTGCLSAKIKNTSFTSNRVKLRLRFTWRSIGIPPGIGSRWWWEITVGLAYFSLPVPVPVCHYLPPYLVVPYI